MLQNKKFGFSLVELVIVLAISALLLVIVGGFYAQRRNVASDDAIQQMVSTIQTIQNETQSNLGPENPSSFSPGETFYGEAIRFSNDTDCTSPGQSCMIVHKLKLSSDGKKIFIYESKIYNNSQGLLYFVGPTVTSYCTDSGYQSCFRNSIQNTTLDFNQNWLVIRSGSGSMYIMNTIKCWIAVGGGYDPACFKKDNQGYLQQAITDSASGEGDARYFLNIDMLNGNSITSNKYTGVVTPTDTPTGGFK